MKKGWTTTKLIAVGGLGVLSFALQLPASAIAIITGVPLMSGFINVFIGPTMDSLTPLVISTFGAATIQRVIIGLLALPTGIAGPPGFFPKVMILLFQGLIIDSIFAFIKPKKTAAMIASSISAVYLIFALVVVGKIFGVPGIAKTAKIFLSPLLLTGTLVAGGISGYLAWTVYKRMENTSVVKRIQSRR